MLKTMKTMWRTLKLTWETLRAKEKTPTFAEVERPPVEIGLTFNDGWFNRIKDLRGWESDAQMARGLDFTPSYICQVKNGQRHISHDLMARLVVLLNLKNGAWWQLFKWESLGVYDGNAQKWNQEKIDGVMPYQSTINLPDQMSNDIWVRPPRYRSQYVNAELELVKGTESLKIEKEELKKVKKSRKKTMI
jgi:plasmid maintenance system antidote protein VapI